jgi:glycosyltransferase domain-containing protein
MTPEEVELLRELTIVIPTYNRPLELERAIEYWRDLPVTVHILDGSIKPYFKVGVLSGLQNFFYHYMPQIDREDPLVNLMRRLTSGATLSKTKFSVICGADDFYIASGLLESLKILESQDVLDAVTGRVLTYERKRNLFWHHKYVPRTNRTDLESDSIEQKLLTGSSWFLYAVCRTPIWQKFLLTCYGEQEFTKANFYAHEWMQFRLTKAMFRTKYIDIIQQVRQDTIIGANKGPEVPWEVFICAGQNAEIVDEIAKQLARGFNEVTPISEHAENLELARDQIRLEQEKALKTIVAPSKSEALKRILGDVVFFVLPGLNVFSDRPRRLRYLWRIPKYQYSAEQQRDVERIEKLLLMPREELRLRVNI